MTRLEKLEQKIKELERRLCCKTQFFDTFGDFPTTGATGVLYIDEETGNIYIWDGVGYSTADAAADHGSLTGLGDDDHTQYALLAGRPTGQTINGGNAANEDITINGTSHGTKTTSYVNLQTTGGSVGIGTITPETGSKLHVVGDIVSRGVGTNSEKFGLSNTAAGTGGVVFGDFSQADGNYSISIGYESKATISTNIAIGSFSNSISGSGAISIGYAAISAGTSSVAVGNSASAAATDAIALGKDAVVPATETGGIALGKGATIVYGSTGGGENIAIGASSSAEEWRATALGYKAKAVPISSTAIGRGAYVTSGSTHGIAIGRGAWANAANQVVIGFSGGNAQTDVFFESGHTSKYLDPIDNVTVTRVPSSTPIAIHGFDAYDATGTPTNNISGGDLILAAGRGTGTGVGGSLLFQTSIASGISNNVKNTLFTRISVLQDGNVGIGTTSPTQKLHVSGTVGSPASSGTTQNGVARVGSNINSSLDFGFLADSPYSAWIQMTNSTDLSNNYPISLNPNGGNVGIGTTSPSTKLHIVGTTEQQRVGYDISNYLSTTINSTGSATLNLVGTSPTFTFSDPVIADNLIRLKGYTVATLPATAVQGDTAFVTDLLGPTYLVTAVGGGAVVGPVFYNGAAWVTS